MKIKFSNKMMKDYDAYIFLVHEGKKDLNKLEQFLKIKLNKKIQNEFEGKINQNVNMYVQSQGKVYHIILGGLGKKEKDNNTFSEVLRKKTGRCIKMIRDTKANRIMVSLYNVNKQYVKSQIVGGLLANYFQINNKGKKTKKKMEQHMIKEICFFNPNAKYSSSIKKIIRETVPITNVVNRMRDLINEPANKLNPETYVQYLTKYIRERKLPIEIEVYLEDKLDKMGMHSFTSVGKGSQIKGKSRMVILKYMGKNKPKSQEKYNISEVSHKIIKREDDVFNNDETEVSIGGGGKSVGKSGVKSKKSIKRSRKKIAKQSSKQSSKHSSKQSSKKISKRSSTKSSTQSTPYVLVGKGITFDTGGISIKTSRSMYEMKSDMAGSAVVLGVILALAHLRAKVNLISILAIAENMPSKTATRPGDVVTSLSGKTVEIVDTDAEGRLVMADCLTYAEKKYKPKALIDIATLTGFQDSLSCGYFSNVMGFNKDLNEKIIESGNISGERIVELPLYPDFDEHLDSSVADLKNVSLGCRSGAITAGKFLSNFVSKKTPWAHLDIAGPAWSSSKEEYTEKEGTGVGIRLLIEFLMNN